jgi:hypothetical protein
MTNSSEFGGPDFGKSKKDLIRKGVGKKEPQTLLRC